MKKVWKIVLVIGILISMLFLLAGCGKNENTAKVDTDTDKFKIVSSFYPMYIIASNVTEGANQIKLENMTETNMGCIHDYTLTTTDLKKLEKANVFVENGLGLENFNDKVIQSYPNIKVINTSDKINNVIKEDEQINGHIWMSIGNYIKQVQNVSDGLSLANPENREKYVANAKKYIEKLEELKQKMRTELTFPEDTYVVSFSEPFEYLAKEVGLQLISVHTGHEESTLSGENLSSVINEVNNRNIKAIIVEKNESRKNAELVAKETGAQIYEIDSAMTGTLNKDAYIGAMEDNLVTLKKLL